VLNLITILAFAMAPMPSESRTMLASWYDHGQTTASGEKFNPDGLTAAHKTLKFGTKVRIRYGSREVKVRINDRGPFTKGRHLDLSRGAARALGFKDVDKVEVLSIIEPS